MILPLPPDRHAEAVALWRAAGLTRPWNDPDADLRRAVDGPTSTVLAALEDDRLVGTVMIGHDGHRGWLYYLAVDEGFRRRGVGRALVAAAEARLGAHVPKTQLMVRGDNAAAVAFWERLGYAVQDTAVLGRFLAP
ncbi:GNAT family acetyltransferase [Actinomycetospora chibensis]|uniref:GNAT family acetyltransferase n=1 Tax=Actinomycetospora chibensis TaxID=663606 RepID=A0ABV9RLW2_9PSEU|nr:GNAT family acetyltransferase [Actinomycetospora chibensis]MDD7926136.1 GNAT family acetyltransferase [Actinomycetospora chibensis]